MIFIKVLKISGYTPQSRIKKRGNSPLYKGFWLHPILIGANFKEGYDAGFTALCKTVMIFNAIGYNYRHSEDFVIDRPNGLNEYLLLIIKSKAVFKFGDDFIHANPYSLILFNKGSQQYFKADKETYINDWVTFTLTSEEEKFFINESVKTDTLIESDSVNACAEIIKLMQKEWCSANPHKDETLELFFKILHTKLKEIFNTKDCVKPYYNELVKIKTDIYNNPSDKYTIESLAQRLNLSKSYFQHLYKKYFDTSPISDVINSRIEIAKQLLSSTTYSIKDISEILGYRNDTQFMKQFKSITGLTAGQYKNRLFEK